LVYLAMWMMRIIDSEAMHYDVVSGLTLR
jgi:hypothetical protein